MEVQIVFFTVLALTCVSAGMATVVTLTGDPFSPTQRLLVRRLTRIALIGTGAIAAFLASTA